MSHFEDFHDPQVMEECLCEQAVYGSGDVWRTKDHRQIRLSDMETSHIKNAHRYLYRNKKRIADSYPDCCDDYLNERIGALEAEVNRRGIKC